MTILASVRRLSAAMETLWSASSVCGGAFVSTKRWIVVATVVMLAIGTWPNRLIVVGLAE